MKSLWQHLNQVLSRKGNRGTRQRGTHSIGDYQSLEPRNLLAAFTVNTTSDVVDLNDGLVSLREAVTAANTNANFGDAAAGDETGDTIQFAPQIANQAIVLVEGEIEITDDLRIIGNGNITIDAQDQSRIFSIDTNQEDVLLSRLTFINGRVSGNEPLGDNTFTISTGTTSGPEAPSVAVGPARNGGAISVSDSNLQISRSRFRSSSSGGAGGAIASFNSDVQIGQTAFTGNRSNVNGGAIFADGGQVNVFQSNFFDNRALNGGAIAIEGGELSVSESTLNENFARGDQFGGGAIYASFGNPLSFAVDPVAISISDSVINDNVTAGDGGGIYLSTSSTASLTGTELEGNIAGFGSEVTSTSVGSLGGGIYSRGNAFISDSTFSSNAASEGGGAIASDGSNTTLRIINSNVADNRARRFGGGISFTSLGGTVTIIDSEVLSNRVNNPIDPANPSGTSVALSGGGLFASGTVARSSSIVEPLVFVRDSIFDGNFAGHRGGGIAALGTRLAIADSIFRNNNVHTVVPFLHADSTVGAENGATGGGAVFHRSDLGSGASPVFGERVFISESTFEDNRISLAGAALASASRLTFLGGAISTANSNATITSSNFNSNISDGGGGGLAQVGASTLKVIDSQFVDNRAGNKNALPDPSAVSTSAATHPAGLGGGIYSRNSLAAVDGAFNAVRIDGGDFTDNSALVSGGGIYSESSIPEVMLLVRADDGGGATVFSGNTALREDGGAIASVNANLVVRDAIFETSNSRSGGAVFAASELAGQELRIVRTVIRDNAARQNGGAVNFFDINFVEFDNLFANNSAINGPNIFEGPAV